MNEESKIFRTDSLGRVRVPVERREELLNEFERSGVSGMKFAKLAGLNYATFADWVQKRRAKSAPAAEMAQVAAPAGEGAGGIRPVRLFEAIVEPGKGSTAGGGLVIELSGGARVVVESPAQLRMAAELLGMLGQTGRRGC